MIVGQFIKKYKHIIHYDDIEWIREQPDAETAIVEACHDRLEIVAREIIPEAWEKYLDAGRPVQAWEEYLDVQRPAWEKYKIIESQAAEKYLGVRRPGRAWEKYLDVPRSSWEEYDTIESRALEEYLDVRRPAWEKYVASQRRARIDILLPAFVRALKDI